MKPTPSPRLRSIWPALSLAFAVTIGLGGCGDGTSLANVPPPPPGSEPPPGSTNPPPPDSGTVVPPPTDTTPPPPSAACTFPDGPSPTPVHVGLPFGPTAVEPSQLGGRYTGTKLTPPPDVTCVLTALELARRANAQVFLNFTGNEQYLRDANGFSMTKWKTRLDRFRKVDFSSYIADGTVIGHFMLDEPNDPTNWNGHIVSQADIEEMARYSKEIWPTLPTFIRTFPEYLVGGQYPDLDAIWFHYLNRWGDLDAFLAEHMGTARSLGLNVIGGLNSLKGGSPEHGIKRGPKYSMGADELRKWGSRFLDEPGLCGFLLWDWDDTYFARPEIPPAVADLAAKARNYTARSCKK